MKDDILESLASLRADIQDCGYDIHITVADNSSNQDHIKEALAQQFPEVLYHDNGGNIGFGAGNTQAFKLVDARYYFALNRDTIIPKNEQVVARIIKFMDAHKTVGCMGPKLLNMDGSLQYSCYRFDLSSLLIKPFKQLHLDEKYAWIRARTDRYLMKDFDHNQTQPVDWVLGAAMVVRKEVVDQIGWFDERYFMYLEDADWCKTMWEHHWSVYYVHDIVIMHRHERGSAKVPGVFRALVKNKLARIHLASWVKYLWKWRHTFKYYGKVS